MKGAPGDVAIFDPGRIGSNNHGERRYDLPGGALDTGESDARALAREFAEEVGLVVHAGRILASAGQYAQTSEGEAVNNRCTLMEAVIDRFDRTLKVEDTHELVWVEPLEALRVVRRESHAWAIACWIRRAAPAGVDV